MRWNPKGSPTDAPRLGLVTEAFADRPLIDVMDWLVRAAPAISDLEVGAGGYAPTGHCDTRRMLTDAAAREAWQREIALGDPIAANIDPSHFFWMGMDPLAVVRAIGDGAGHCHGKDVVFAAQNLAVNGLLDRRWPRAPEAMPWNFSVVGRGHDAAWWRDFVGALGQNSRLHTIAIEHEDPFVDPEQGIPEAVSVIASAWKRPGC